jgi:hypothetical protein
MQSTSAYRSFLNAARVLIVRPVLIKPFQSGVSAELDNLVSELWKGFSQPGRFDSSVCKGTL